MRERRWESTATLQFPGILELGERLKGKGLQAAPPGKDLICYIEEWAVNAPEDLDALDPWPLEDVTLVHVMEEWKGDFFLLAGAYHTVYREHEGVGTYCSISHPWRLSRSLLTHHERAMLWLGFRHVHSFIRVRLHTAEVITPGETRADGRRSLWLAERQQAFEEAIEMLDLPIEIEVDPDKRVVSLRAADPTVPLFCSWPDAFGPCQFEYNSSDPFEFLVPASRLSATHGDRPATVRAYLTGFSESALEEFSHAAPQGVRLAYRCSAHCPLDELPEVLRAIAPDGRLYATLCEFSVPQRLPGPEEASVIVGAVGHDGQFQVEVRLNHAPFPEEEMGPWVEELLGLPVSYAPLPPFP